MMTTNSPIPLDIVFQQCYDPDYLDPDKNKEGCFSCFQGVYAVPDQSISQDDLARTIYETWGNIMNAEAFRDALAFFKKADGAQAFDNGDIAVLVSKYYVKQKTVHFNYPDRVSSIPSGSRFVEMGNVGADGLLNKVIASTDLTDQGGGGTWGSDWRIFITRDGNNVAEAIFAVGNPDHINPQYLRNVEHIFDPPPMLFSTDKVMLGAAQWYPGHAAIIVNTSFDLFIST